MMDFDEIERDEKARERVLAMVHTTDAEVAVGAGVALLDDQLDPDWALKIRRVHLLEMESPSACVLGLLFGTYDDGVRYLTDFDAGWVDEAVEWAHEHGFIGSYPRDNSPVPLWNDLQEAWLEVITNRQAVTA